MATEEEKYQSLQFTQFEVRLGGALLFLVDVDDGITLDINGVRKQITNVAGYQQQVYKQWQVATTAAIALTAKKPSISTIVSELLVDQLESEGVVAFGGIKIVDTSTVAKELWLHPVGAGDDYSNDFKGWLATSDLSQTLSLLFNGTDPEELTVNFTLDRDRNKPLAKQFFAIGDWSYVPSAPKGLSIVMDDSIAAPGLCSLSQAKLKQLAVDRLKVFACYGDISTAVTFKLNMGAGITGTSTNVIFDTLSIANALNVGDYVYTGTQALYITAITYDTGGLSGNFDCIRAAAGTTTAAAIDDADFALLENFWAEKALDKATWSSGDIAACTVGNTVITTTYTERKGVLKNVTTDPGTIITATLSAVSQTIDIITE
jgi:hypothetical protein